MIGLFLFPKIAKNMEREKVRFPSCGLPAVGLVLLLILGIRVPMFAMPISPAIWPSSAS